jgi:DNA-binding MarR family transcriptional regulator
MAGMAVTLKELEERQRAVLALIDELNGATDPKRVQALANQLSREGAELDALAKRFEREELDRAGPRQTGGKVEVELTPEQRARIRLQTGIDLVSVTIPDETGTMTRSMPHQDPDWIEWLAMKEALMQRAAADSMVSTRKSVAAVLDELAQKGGRSARELVERLKSDPRWRRLIDK